MRIKSNSSGFGENLAAQQAICISNALYGNDTCSAHELVKVFFRPVVPVDQIIIAFKSTSSERNHRKCAHD